MTTKTEQPTCCLNILYPNQEDEVFDIEYYGKELLAEYTQVLGDNFIGYEIRKAITLPDAPPPSYYCSINIYIRSVARYEEAMYDERMQPIMEKIIAIGGNVRPIRQFEEVVHNKTANL